MGFAALWSVWLTFSVFAGSTGRKRVKKGMMHLKADVQMSLPICPTKGQCTFCTGFYWAL